MERKEEVDMKEALAEFVEKQDIGETNPSKGVLRFEWSKMFTVRLVGAIGEHRLPSSKYDLCEFYERELD